MNENKIEQFVSLCEKELDLHQKLIMFKDADPQVLMDGEEQKQLTELDDIVTVYRGVTSYNAKNIKALSWTLEQKTAEWFAHRFGEDGTVYEAQIPKQHIYALFNCFAKINGLTFEHLLYRLLDAVIVPDYEKHLKIILELEEEDED